MFGRLCKLPFDLPKSTTTINEPHQYVGQLKEYLEAARQMVHTQILFHQQRSKQRYDNNRTNEVYTIGDFVYVKRHGFGYKLTQKYFGPYQIIQQLNESVYRIQNPNDLHEIINIHVNRLRRWYPTQ